MDKSKKIRVLVAKLGLAGHDRGAKGVARALRAAGLAGIYTGIRQTPEMIVATAIQEDVDVVGLSSLSGAHMELFPEIIKGLAKKGKKDSLFICGGIIPDEDIPKLKRMGVQEVFGPGTSTKDIVNYIVERFKN